MKTVLFSIIWLILSFTSIYGCNFGFQHLNIAVVLSSAFISVIIVFVGFCIALFRQKTREKVFNIIIEAAEQQRLTAPIMEKISIADRLGNVTVKKITSIIEGKQPGKSTSPHFVCSTIQIICLIVLFMSFTLPHGDKTSYIMMISAVTVCVPMAVLQIKYFKAEYRQQIFYLSLIDIFSKHPQDVWNQIKEKVNTAKKFKG